MLRANDTMRQTLFCGKMAGKRCRQISVWTPLRIEWQPQSTEAIAAPNIMCSCILARRGVFRVF
jgi:hypothetical protein